MYPIENLTITDFESAKKEAEMLFNKAGQSIVGYFYENACLILAAMLFHLKKENKLNAVYLYRLLVVSYGNYEQFLKRVRDDKDISQALAEIFSLSDKKAWDTLGGIWMPLKDVVIYLDSYKPLTFDEYRQKYSAIVKEIKLKTQELSNLTERYCRTCPESELIGKRVRAWALTSEKGKLKDIGTGYLKEIKYYERGVFYYVIYLENEDGTPSTETYTGPIIVKVELIENN